MSTGGGPDLFVVCKNCGSEVSPYITECPYCGNRLRKRAPKLDGKGGIAERPRAKRAPSSLGRIKRGEIPGIRHDSHAYVTITAVLLSAVGALFWRTGLAKGKLVAFGPLGQLNLGTVYLGRFGSSSHNISLDYFRWWHVVTAPFLYSNVGYAVIAGGAIAVYGLLLERRHGPAPVLALILIGGIGGIAAAHAASLNTVAIGGNGAALALLVAWAMQDVLALRAKVEIEGDLLITAVIGAMVVLMPLATYEASWTADAVGILLGAVAGAAMARIHPT